MLSDFGQAKQTNYSGVAVQDRLCGKMIPPEALDTDQLTRTFDIYQITMVSIKRVSADCFSCH